MRKRILSISYDVPLLHTREMLLESEGFKVISAVGFDQAVVEVERGRYDLAIIGHSIPLTEKKTLAKKIKGCVPSVRILSLRRHGDKPLPEADYSIEAAEGPSALVATVIELLQ